MAWLALGPGTRGGRRELAATVMEVRQWTRRLARQWRELPPAQRRFFWAQLAVLTAVRLGLSLTQHWGDDAMSLDYFVRQGWLAVAAYYPAPNNHILSNTLAWGFYQVHPGFWWSMRLPVLLTSTVGTVLLFVVLWRRLGYWPSLLAAGAMSWVQLSLQQATAGRGYWLVVVMTGALFWALLTLLDEAAVTRPQRVAWAVLVWAGILGSYAVPTFAYVLASAFSWLALQVVRCRRWVQLGQGVAAGAIVVSATVLLYTPTLYVSGPTALFNNPYVQPLGVADFWRALPAHAWATEGYLVGQRHAGAVLTLLGLGVFVRRVWQWRAGLLAPEQARQVREIGLTALWFFLFPYVLLLGQHVLPPERTWLYKAWFFFVLVGLGLDGWNWHSASRRRLLRWGLGIFVGYQVIGQLRLNYLTYRQTAELQGVYQWLRTHPQVGTVLIPDMNVWAWLRFQTCVDAPTQPWQPDCLPQPGIAYTYIITGVDKPSPTSTRTVVLNKGRLRIYKQADRVLAPMPAVHAGPK